MRKTFLHEDDIAQIEIVPFDGLEYCTQEMREVEAFSEKHRDPSGFGWSKVYIREEAKAKLSDLNVDLSAIQTILAQAYETFDEVETGYSSHREPLANAQAYGEHLGVVFYVLSASEKVTDIWASIAIHTVEQRKQLAKVLSELGSMAPLILCDWSLGSIVNLADDGDIERYLRECDVQALRVSEAIEKYRTEVASFASESVPPKPWWKFWSAK
jgi:hypothetical protein